MIKPTNKLQDPQKRDNLNNHNSGNFKEKYLKDNE